MTIIYTDDLTTLYLADVIEGLRQLPADSVHTVVTSPPYWALRNYGVEGQLGLEATPQLYIEKMVGVFCEIKRVLRPDGTCWMNMGDSYATESGNHEDSNLRWTRAKIGRRPEEQGVDFNGKYKSMGIKPLDLVGMPWRLALALQAEGWFLRSDVIWNKLNPVPESVNGWRWEQHRVKVGNQGRGKESYRRNALPQRPIQDHSGDDFKADAVFEPCPGCEKCSMNGGLVLKRGNWRPTKAHEYVFLMAKTDQYFCNMEAVRESLTKSSVQRLTQPSFDRQTGGAKDPRNGGEGSRNRSDRNALENLRDAMVNGQAGRNKRTVWTLATDSYSEDHFATFPEALPMICILASTADKVCASCGTPYAPIVDRDHGNFNKRVRDAKKGIADQTVVRRADAATEAEVLGYDQTKEWQELSGRVTGQRPCCDCQAETVPATVLDPFAGSGTTLAVAKMLGRRSIGVEISPRYCKVIERRLGRVSTPMF